jgi:hypothetical protein
MNAPLAQWKQREISRFNDGTYTSIPVSLDYPSSHYVHLSTAKAEEDYVAYTPSDAYGVADRQVRLRFGRYLKKTFGSMADSEIQGHVTALKSAVKMIESPATLHFATDIDTINQIFETRMNACGSSVCSCMYGKFNGDAIRPYHVYANSPDVAVAYVTANGEIIARSVVSTKDMEWVRAYSVADGDNDADCGTLRRLLGDAGYSKGDLYGNRLTKLDTEDVMLPYIDHNGCHVKDKGRYWLVVDGEGDYAADNTDGTATPEGDRCSTCGDREDNCECIYCDCCQERYAHGCDDCSFCEHCEGCTEHNGCSCDRCSDCYNLIEHYRHCSHCECDRCGECGALDNECECEKCDECGRLTDSCECEETETETETETEMYVELTPGEARLKLNRIFIYLRDTHGVRTDSDEFRILRTACDSIEITMEVAA